MKLVFLVSLLFASQLASSPLYAYMTVGESGELFSPNIYKLTVEPQLKTSDGGGFDGTVDFDAMLTESSSFRLQVGGGETDFYTGASLKWIPYPDLDHQPAVGARIGTYVGRDGSDNFFTVRLEPLVSKKLFTEYGTFVPYGSLPWMLTSIRSTSTSSVQIAFGSEFMDPQTPEWIFGAEIALNGKDSFSYISAYAAFLFDQQKN